MKRYRHDIDGLRALAVIAVILFHLGFLPNGYLGVDVFFVISGYLISSIIYREITEQRFSFIHFYERRIRRIIPLLLLITGVALILGLWLMLPKDLESLCQSIVASNFSANNLLMLWTTGDYWAIVNDYKPLMHTWSLGIEEQFYLLFPLLMMGLYKMGKRWILPGLFVFATLSLFFFLTEAREAHRFYLLQYRFFELALGGIAGIYFYSDPINLKPYRTIYYLGIPALIICLALSIGSGQTLLLLTVLFTSLLLVLGKSFYETDKWSRYIFQNKTFTFIGKISFSLYMWHQLLFAFARYAFYDPLSTVEALSLILLAFFLSIGSYYGVEQPFRNRHKWTFKKVLLLLAGPFILISTIAFYLYAIGGVYKDVPSLDLYTKDQRQRGFNGLSAQNNIHSAYNERNRRLNRPFPSQPGYRVLVIGDSYGRDLLNVLRENQGLPKLNLAYADLNQAAATPGLKQQISKADFIFYTSFSIISPQFVDSQLDQIMGGHSFPLPPIYYFGPKSFGYSNGINYRHLKQINNFNRYAVPVSEKVILKNNQAKKAWGSQYISMLDPVLVDEKNVRVFTQEGKFISQDGRHLTPAGARFYSQQLKTRLESILTQKRQKSSRP